MIPVDIDRPQGALKIELWIYNELQEKISETPMENPGKASPPSRTSDICKRRTRPSGEWTETVLLRGLSTHTATVPASRYSATLSSTSSKVSPGEMISTAISGAPLKKPFGLGFGIRALRTNDTSGARTVSGLPERQKPASDVSTSPRSFASACRPMAVESRPPKVPCSYPAGAMVRNSPFTNSCRMFPPGISSSSAAVINPVVVAIVHKSYHVRGRSPTSPTTPYE